MAPDIRDFITKNVNKNNSELKVTKNVRNATIAECQERKIGYVNPVIVAFQNGNFNENFAKDFNVILTPKPNGGTNVEVKTSNKQIFKDINFNETKEKKIVAIRNKKTNKIKILDVDSTVLINSVLLSSSDTTDTSSSYFEDVKTLNKTFGSKKKVLQLLQKEKLNLNTSLIADEVQETISEIKVKDTDTSASSSNIESLLSFIPPCNRDATVLDDVYKLNEILSEEELEELKAEVSSEEFSPKNYSEFFRYCLSSIEKSKEDLTEKMAGLLYVEMLINFIVIPAKKLMSKNLVLCSFSSLIHTKIIKDFCVKSNHLTRPLSMKDKTLCYIMVVTLISCNYKINLKLLSTLTEVNFTKLSRLAQVIGAVPLNKDQNIFILKLPLPKLPAVKRRKNIH